MKALRDIHAVFLNQLREHKGEREAKSLFLFAMQQIDQLDMKAFIYNEQTANEAEYLDCLEKLKGGLPIQYHFGHSSFCDLDLLVNPSVLIPRPETEELVQWVAHDLKDKELSILDVGTGSGCIAIALAKQLPLCTLSACDLSPDALELARQNAESIGVQIAFSQLDALHQPLPTADVIVSNPPYIPISEAHSLPKDVRDHEPELALFVSEQDPLVFYRRIIQICQERRTVCYLEIHEEYQEELEKLLAKFGGSFLFKKDLQGKYRMLRYSANETF